MHICKAILLFVSGGFHTKEIAGCYGDIAHTLAALSGRRACLTHAHVLNCRRWRSCSMQEGVWLPRITWTEECPHEVLRLRGGSGARPKQVKSWRMKWRIHLNQLKFTSNVYLNINNLYILIKIKNYNK